jgi:hypothetical protein
VLTNSSHPTRHTVLSPIPTTSASTPSATQQLRSTRICTLSRTHNRSRNRRFSVAPVPYRLLLVAAYTPLSRATSAPEKHHCHSHQIS